MPNNGRSENSSATGQNPDPSEVMIGQDQNIYEVTPHKKTTTPNSIYNQIVGSKVGGNANSGSAGSTNQANN